MRWPRLSYQVTVPVLPIVVGCAAALFVTFCAPPGKPQPDICDTPSAWVTDYGSPAICREVRKAQREGLELTECVKQDGHTYCIMIDRKRETD